MVFDFPALPSVVQDLIVNEIVHNSLPEDRIQFAQTSKCSNELVQRAHPKKIMKNFAIGRWKYNNGEWKWNSRSPTEWMEILQKCQVESLDLHHLFFSPQYQSEYPEFLDILYKASKFATKLDIWFDNKPDGFEEFYEKLNHLNTVVFHEDPLLLPRYPRNLVFRGWNFDECYSPWVEFFEHLAKKTEHSPLSYLSVGSYIYLHFVKKILQVKFYLKFK